MIAARPILYGIIGFLFGGILGSAASLVLPENADFRILIVCAVGGALGGALLFGWAGYRLSRAQQQSASERGYFFIVNRIAGVFIISVLGVQVAASSFVTPMALPEYATLAIGILSNVIGVWAGVAYVVSKKYLRADHDPFRIATWFTGLWIVLGVVAYPVLFVSERGAAMLTESFSIISLLPQVVLMYGTIFGATYFFSWRAISSMVSRVPVAVPQQAAAIPQNPSQVTLVAVQQGVAAAPPLRAHMNPIVVAGAVAVVIALAAAAYFFLDKKSSAKAPYTREEVASFIRERIIPSVVQLQCLDEAGNVQGIGSGIYTHDAEGNPIVMTNAHVILATDGKYHGCVVYFPRPDDGSFFESAYETGTAVPYHNVIAGIEATMVDGLDYAVVALVRAATASDGTTYPFPPEKPDVLTELEASCRKQSPTIDIGDPVYGIGYPGIGGETITLTEGVVSGYGGQFNEILKISANINHGNSGGLVVGASDACYYGIPTAASFAAGGALGFVLSGDFISAFTSNLTDRMTYSPPETEEEVSAQLQKEYTFEDFTMKYPMRWEVNQMQDEQGDSGLGFVSPSEGALDNGTEVFQVTTVHGVSDDMASKFLRDLSASADLIDPENERARIELKNGLTMYTLQLRDNTLVTYPNPVVIRHDIFLIKDTLYHIMFVLEAGPRAEAFMRLYVGALQSIRLR